MAGGDFGIRRSVFNVAGWLVMVLMAKAAANFVMIDERTYVCVCLCVFACIDRVSIFPHAPQRRMHVVHSECGRCDDDRAMVSVERLPCEDDRVRLRDGNVEDVGRLLVLPVVAANSSKCKSAHSQELLEDAHTYIQVPYND